MKKHDITVAESSQVSTNSERSDTSSNSTKMPYHSPKLTAYGEIVDLVQSFRGSGFDAGGGFPNDTRS